MLRSWSCNAPPEQQFLCESRAVTHMSHQSRGFCVLSEPELPCANGTGHHSPQEPKLRTLTEPKLPFTTGARAPMRQRSRSSHAQSEPELPCATGAGAHMHYWSGSSHAL